MLLSLLANHRVPLRAESKYSNTIELFDVIKKSQDLVPSKPPSG